MCGGDWFRLVNLYEFLREEVIVAPWDSKDGLLGQVTAGPTTIGICSCGTPWELLIGGVSSNWGATAQTGFAEVAFNNVAAVPAPTSVSLMAISAFALLALRATSKVLSE